MQQYYKFVQDLSVAQGHRGPRVTTLRPACCSLYKTTHSKIKVLWRRRRPYVQIQITNSLKQQFRSAQTLDACVRVGVLPARIWTLVKDYNVPSSWEQTNP